VLNVKGKGEMASYRLVGRIAQASGNSSPLPAPGAPVAD
jgi:hypothetical protein